MTSPLSPTPFSHVWTPSTAHPRVPGPPLPPSSFTILTELLDHPRPPLRRLFTDGDNILLRIGEFGMCHRVTLRERMRLASCAVRTVCAGAMWTCWGCVRDGEGGGGELVEMVRLSLVEDLCVVLSLDVFWMWRRGHSGCVM